MIRLRRPALLGPAFLLLLSCGGGPITPGPTPTPSPAVLSITPSSGPTTGGTSVRITGSNFSAGATVTIGGAAATEVIVESASSISAKTGARTTPGAADVTVTSGARSGTLAAAFTYVTPTSAPPVIVSVSVRGTRTNQPPDFADLGEEVNVTAVVQDPDTPANQLSVEWSAPSGTFSGTGTAVRWRAPSQATIPTTVVLTLTVSDIPGQRVTGTVTVRVHDSVREVGEMARDFLRDFSDSNILPSVVMRNFSTTGRCEDTYKAELADVERNRKEYRITSSTIGSSNVTFLFAGRPCSYAPVNGDACAVIPASWESICLPAHPSCPRDSIERVSGTDYVTAVYEQSRWKLCASFYEVRGTLGTRFIR